MEKNELIATIKEQLEAFKGNLGSYASAEDVNVVKEQLELQMKELNMKNELVELTNTVKEYGETISKLRAKHIGEDEKTLKDVVEEQADVLKDIRNGIARNATIHVSKADVLRSSVGDHTLAYRLPGVGQLDTSAAVIAGLFRAGRVGPNSNGIIRYVDQETIVRGADTVAEAGQKPESSIAWQEYTLPLQKIADTIPVSRESLMDVDFIASEIQRLLEVNLQLKEDEQVWSGDGTPPNLSGVYTTAMSYTAPNAGISDANVYDLIIKVQEEISRLAGAKYQPNFVVMNHSDINKMRLWKDTQNNYILPPFVSADGSSVAGIKVIPSNTVAPNTLLVGDFNYGTLYTLEDVTIEIGYINDQFTHNMVTILAEKREALLVRNADKRAFYKVEDIDAALAALATTTP